MTHFYISILSPKRNLYILFLCKKKKIVVIGSQFTKYQVKKILGECVPPKTIWFVKLKLLWNHSQVV